MALIRRGENFQYLSKGSHSAVDQAWKRETPCFIAEKQEA